MLQAAMVGIAGVLLALQIKAVKLYGRTEAPEQDTKYQTADFHSHVPRNPRMVSKRAVIIGMLSWKLISYQCTVRDITELE